MLSGSHRRYDGNEINMDELDNSDNYNGDPVHNMEVDYGHHINTGNLLPTMVTQIFTNKLITLTIGIKYEVT